MPNFPLVLSLAPFPTGVALDADEFGQQLIANLSATLTGNFLLGQVGGTAPINNIGPWFDGTFWQAWNGTSYVPVAPPGGPTPTVDIGPWFDGQAWNIWNSTLSIYTPIPQEVDTSVIINGQMNIWQRANDVSIASANNGGYVADRWKIGVNLATGVSTVEQLAANITGTTDYPYTEYVQRTVVTTAESAGITASELFTISQPVERQVAMSLFGNTSSLSVLLRSNIAGTFCVSIRNIGGTQSYVQECVIAESNTFQLFQFPDIPALPITLGNWGSADTDECYLVSLCLACGSTFQTSEPVAGVPQTWVSGNFLGTLNQTNLFATIGNYLDFTLVRHEPGSTCNPFYAHTFNEDLTACQRYFCKSFDYGTYSSNLPTFNGCINFALLDSQTALGNCMFPVRMRSTPTITVFSPIGGQGDAYDWAGASNRVLANLGAAAVPTASGFNQMNLGTASATAAASGFTNFLGLQFYANADF